MSFTGNTAYAMLPQDRWNWLTTFSTSALCFVILYSYYEEGENVKCKEIHINRNFYNCALMFMIPTPYNKLFFFPLLFLFLLFDFTYDYNFNLNTIMLLLTEL
jgi:hypothetical protein